jgi:hypothetical protein
MCPRIFAKLEYSKTIEKQPTKMKKKKEAGETL